MEFDNGAIFAWGSVSVSALIGSGPYNKSGFYYSDAITVDLPFTLASGYGALSSNNLTTASNLMIGSAGNTVGFRLLGGAKQTTSQTYVLSIIIMGIAA